MKFFMWKPPFLTSSVRWSSLFAASSSSSSFFLRSYLSKPLLHHRHHLSLPSVKVPSTSSSSHSTSFLFRRSTWLVAFTTLPTLFILWHGYPSEIHQTHLHGTWRSFNTLLYVSNIMFKYKKVFWNFGHFGIDSDIYLEEREKVHQQSADLLLELCRMHGGIYIKAAQHLASMLRIVPKAYTDTLSVLQDKAPFRSFEEIANVIVKEFGMHPSDLFLEFDQKPLAAASLAQVHRAVTHQMEECAVKVQYPEVQRNFHIDIRCMEVLTKLVSLIFPEFHLGWIVQEFKSNLLQEFDFELEAHHSETTAGRFQHHKHFHVPKVIWPLTTHKVLTMEYIRGLPLKSVEELQKQGVSTYQIAQTLIDIFSEMVFVHGFVHCDP
ncbi:putative aarF domain-containing protein kinase 5, partial [Coelomomyces lativittatus]